MDVNLEPDFLRVTEKAAEVALPAAPMLQYVNEWRDIREIWNRPTDPMERARASP